MNKHSRRITMIFLCGAILTLTVATGVGAKDNGMSLTEKVENLLRKYETLREENQEIKDTLEEAEGQVELYKGKFIEAEDRVGVLQKQLETRTRELQEAQTAVKDKEGAVIQEDEERAELEETIA